MRKIGLWGGVTVLVIVLIGAVLVSQSPKAEQASPDAAGANPHVPDFTLPDMQGQQHSLDEFSGKPLVINIWASWRGFCTKELPAFAELQRTTPEITVIAINRGESRDRAQQFISENDLTGKLLFLRDPDDTFYQDIGGFSMPETLFVDAKGRIVTHHRGPLKLSEMRELTQDIINNS